MPTSANQTTYHLLLHIIKDTYSSSRRSSRTCCITRVPGPSETGALPPTPTPGAATRHKTSGSPADTAQETVAPLPGLSASRPWSWQQILQWRLGAQIVVTSVQLILVSYLVNISLVNLYTS